MAILRRGGWVAALILMSASMGAPAEDANPGQAQPDEGKNSAAPPAANVIEEIVVTARRREEEIQDVPIAIDALSGGELSKLRVTDAIDLQFLTPALSVVPTLTRDQLTYSMRGQAPIYGAAPNVIVYLNDVPIAANASIFPFFDLASVQALEGPQGTLFGRNSTGGAVLINSVSPTDKFEGYVAARTGSLNLGELEAAVNVPLAEAADLRIAGLVSRRTGYTEDTTFDKELDGRHRDAFRVSLKLQPIADFSNLTVYDQTDINEGGSSSQLTYVRPCALGGPLSCSPFLAPLLVAATDPRSEATSTDPFLRATYWGLTNTTTYDADVLMVKNIVSYRRATSHSDADVDGTILPLVDVEQLSGINSVTEELQLSGKALQDRLKWLGGAFYSQDKYYKPYLSIVDTTTQVNGIGNNDDSSHAIFAQGDYDLGAIVQHLSFTAGARYTWESDSADDFTYVSNGNGGLQCGSFGFPASTPLADCFAPGSGNWSSPTYLVSLNYKPIDRVLLYATNSTGFKSGTFNGTNVSPDERNVLPEKVKNYEAGFKSDWNIGGALLRANASIYLDKYSDIQVQETLPNGLSSAVFNAAKATIKGLELQVSARLFDALEISSSYDDTLALYNEFRDLEGNDLSSSPFAMTPHHKTTLSADYTLPFDRSIGNVSLGASYSEQAGFYFNDPVIQNPNAYQGAYGLVDVRASWSGIYGSPLDLSVIAKNVGNRAYLVGGVSQESSLGIVSGIYGEPRTVTVELRYRFGENAR